MIDIVGDDAVLCSVAVFVRLLVADKHIERLLVMNYAENILLDAVYLLRFLLVQLALSAVAVCERRFVILIRKYCVKRGTVASRNSVVGLGVFDIFNTVFAENDAPMRFGIIGIFLEYLVVDFFRFIKLAL